MKKNMTQADFVAQLGATLQGAGKPFDRRHVIEFVEDLWSLIDMDPNAKLWAEPFWRWQSQHTEAEGERLP
jgi:hypothetical protein